MKDFLNKYGPYQLCAIMFGALALATSVAIDRAHYGSAALYVLFALMFLTVMSRVMPK